MNAPHIQSVELAQDGVIVMYDDHSCAFYHESVLQAHLASGEKKPVASALADSPVKVRRMRAGVGANSAI